MPPIVEIRNIVCKLRCCLSTQCEEDQVDNNIKKQEGEKIIRRRRKLLDCFKIRTNATTKN
jgi:hypothetical protein